MPLWKIIKSYLDVVLIQNLNVTSQSLYISLYLKDSLGWLTSKLASLKAMKKQSVDIKNLGKVLSLPWMGSLISVVIKKFDKSNFLIWKLWISKRVKREALEPPANVGPFKSLTVLYKGS